MKVLISFAALFRFIYLVSSPKCLITSSLRSQKLLLNALCTPRFQIQGIINVLSPTSVLKIASVLWIPPLPITPGLVGALHYYLMGRLLVFWFSYLGENGHLCLRVGWSLCHLWEPGICLIMWACQRSKKGIFTCIGHPSYMLHLLHLLHWDHSGPRAWKRPSLFHHKPLCIKVLPVFLSYPWQKGLWLRKEKGRRSQERQALS